MRYPKVLWITLATILIVESPTRASLSSYQEATEAMMNSQGLILSLAATHLGVDAGAESLSFTSMLDPLEKKFRYSLQDGSTYLGMPATLQVAGAFNDGTGEWLWTSSGHLGPTNLSGNGSSYFFGDPMSTDVFVTLTLDETIVSDVTYENTAIRTVSSGTITVKDILGIVKSSGKHTDEYITSGPNQGKWKWDTGLITGRDGKLALNSSGFSPAPDGGLGTFTVSITAVPEPGSLCLVGIATLIGGAAHLRRGVGIEIQSGER